MEGVVVSSLVAFLALLVVGVAVGYLNLTYLLYLLSLSGMYILLSLGLNVQWGYAGLINFSVAAFFGIGAYGAALLTANASPIAGNFGPLVGLLGGLLAAAVLAVLIGVPTLRLRADYLAIASLGLAEVVRRVILNEQQWTQGSAGLTGIPLFFSNWPVLGSFTEPLLVAILNVALVAVFIAICYLFLRRLHRSPWGRVLRTIRSDEDLAKALGKNTYAFRMQAFVIGSIIMALGGVFYVNLTLYIDPNALRPIRTFYVWVAVILGGSGSDSGAMFGGFAIIAILEGTRFLNNVIAFSLNTAALRLLLTGVLIIAIMRLRPEGILPPHRELIWPSALEGEQDE
jgi:branched-chain amino acid transport system permease protein